EVQNADDRAPRRVVDRRTGAGELAQLVGVVLAAVDQRLLAAADGGADAVRAGELLGVRVPRGQRHRVQAAGQVPAGGAPVEHDAGVVGEDDADRLVLQLLVQRVEDRGGAAQQGSGRVPVGQVRHVDAIDVDVVLLAALPRGQDQPPHVEGV